MVASAAVALAGCAAALLGGAASSGAYRKDTRGASQLEGDRAMASAVRARLASDPVTKVLAISVDASQAIVTLRGDVKKAEQRAAAERVTLSVRGVKAVRNELRVRG